MQRLPAGLRFAKLQASGNDFALVDGRVWPVEFDVDAVRALSDRRFGIGFDQLLILLGAGDELEVRIFNADGSGAEQCGNGMRAIAAWLDSRMELAEPLRVATPAGDVRIEAAGDGRFTAELPGPSHAEPAELGLPPIPPDLGEAVLVTMGNPHLVVFTDRTPEAEALSELVAELARDPDWSDRVNVGLAQRRADGRLRLRVHERGSGPTLACGSGACAAAWAAFHHATDSGSIVVEQPGGDLVVDWPTTGRVVTTGPATVVFEGRVR